MARDQFLRHLLAHFRNDFFDLVGAHDFEPLLEDHLALIVEHIVEFQDVLADFEVAGFDFLLRFFERLVDPGMGDRLAFFETQALQNRIHALRPEDAHQIVLQAEIEFRGAGIALAARPAAQLIVDAPAFVALGAENEQAARGDHAAPCRARLLRGFRRHACCARLRLIVMSASSSLMRMSGLPPS